MYPVRKDLIGKRFAFVRSDGRSGTRYHAFSEPSNANVDDLNWFSGSILATNVEEVDVKSKTEGEEKKIKVSLGY